MVRGRSSALFQREGVSWRPIASRQLFVQAAWLSRSGLQTLSPDQGELVASKLPPRALRKIERRCSRAHSRDNPVPARRSAGASLFKSIDAAHGCFLTMSNPLASIPSGCLAPSENILRA